MSGAPGAGSPGLRGRARTWIACFRSFGGLAGLFWRGATRWPAFWATVGVVALTIAQVIVPIAINRWNEKFFDALEQKAFDQFAFLLAMLGAIIVGNIAVVTLHLAVKRRLQVGWRKWLTRRLLDEWMTAGRHYQVTYLPGEHDNPDGRIAEDIRIATEYAIDLVHSLFYCALLLVSFTRILWSLSGPPTVSMGGVEFFLPGHLVWVAILYAGIGTFVASLLGQPMVRAANRRQRAEADFRFELVHARENSLAIALLHGETDERSLLQRLFEAAATAWDRQTRALMNFFFFNSGWSVLSQVFPILVVAPRYMAGAITLGALMQTAQAFQQMAGALSWPIDNLAKLSEWRASAERVMGLHEALGRLTETVPDGRAAGIALEPGDRPALELIGLRITEPDGEVVIERFDAAVQAGDRILMSGDSAGALKLFKAVAGLWPWGDGRIRLPADGAIFFMPHRPYFPIGRLRDAVTYPDDGRTFTDDQVAHALRQVGLDHLVGRLEETSAWKQMLSIGEQQRLGFARLILHRADWVFIQEATDALDRDGAARMMHLLQDELPNAAVITIGHHSTLAAHHRLRFVLTRGDGVRIEEITDRRSGRRDRRNLPALIAPPFS